MSMFKKISQKGRIQIKFIPLLIIMTVFAISSCSKSTGETAPTTSDTDTTSVTNTVTSTATSSTTETEVITDDITQTETITNSVTQTQTQTVTDTISDTQTSTETNTNTNTNTNDSIEANINLISATSGAAPYTLLANTSASSYSEDNDEIFWYIDERLIHSDSEISEILPTVKEFVLTLKIIDTTGQESIQSITINVTEADIENQAPIASTTGTSPISGDGPLTVNFSSTSSSDENLSNATYLWDFKDGSMGSIQANPTHIFESEGEYLVSLIITDDLNESSETATVLITVTHQFTAGDPPIAQATTTSDYGPTPLVVTLDGSTSYASPGSSIVKYEWDFGNGNYQIGDEISHTFTDPYVHDVTLMVTDELGQVGEHTIRISALGTLPPAKPGVALQTDGNPFTDALFYVSPDIDTMIQEHSLDKVLAEDPNNEELIRNIRFVQGMPSAVWLDRIDAIHGGDINGGRRSLRGHLEEATAQQLLHASADGTLPPMVAVIIVYNLPDRDCAAKASNGTLHEVTDGDGDGEPDLTGMAIYEEDYINVIADTFADFPNLRIVAMMEPDSYPNMITNIKDIQSGSNLDTSICKLVAAGKVYERGIQYAIAKFYDITHKNVYTYLDIGHSGWLGWKDNLEASVTGFTTMVAGANRGLDVIEGFVSNTAGYTPLDEPFLDGFAIRGENWFEWNEYIDEHTFIDKLREDFVKKGFPDDVGFIIDTARNGWGGPGRPTSANGKIDHDRVDKRKHRGHWCNANHAGIGEIPRANPDPSRPHLDAYYLMKPPGESDGISDFNATEANEEGKSYDPMCSGDVANTTAIEADVIKPAPHAGHWFHDQFVMLINNAYPVLGVQQPLHTEINSKASAYKDDFESYEAGKNPKGKWIISAKAPGSIKVSTEQVYRGKQSVKISAPANKLPLKTVMRIKADGIISGVSSRLYGRMFMYLEELDDLPDLNPSDQANQGQQLDLHRFTFTSAMGNHPQEGDMTFKAGMEGDGIVTAGVKSQNLKCNMPSLAFSIPKETWSCVEWKFDASNGEMKFWIDGLKVDDLEINPDFKHTDGTVPNCQWKAPDSFEQIEIGIDRPHGDFSRNMYIDDVTLSNGRVGCGITRK